MTELTLKMPIKIKATEGNGFVITDAQNSEFFFYTDEASGKLIYDGCCVNLENKHIVFNHLVNDELNKKSK